MNMIINTINNPEFYIAKLQHVHFTVTYIYKQILSYNNISQIHKRLPILNFKGNSISLELHRSTNINFE